ncbi:hypothetical protein ACWCXK_38670 [Streptomyces sp. NPDC001739]
MAAPDPAYVPPRLRITLLAGREPPEVRFELKCAVGGATAETVEDLTACLADLGFTDLSPSAQPPTNYALPGPVLDRLAMQVGAILGPGRPLWLDLVHPAGVLALVPWERLLQPRLKVPLLRLPTAPLDLARSRTTLDVALIADDPLEKPQHMAERLRQLTERIVVETPLPTFVHVFTDADTHRELPRQGWPSGHYSEVLLYDPADEAALPPLGDSPRPDEAADSAWLRWVRRAAVTGQMDVVHLLAHGRLLSVGAALLFSAAPQAGERLSGAVTLLSSAALDRFMTQVGAWSLVLSSTPTRRSGSSQRLFADSMARARPGSVLWHDLPADSGARCLGEAYRFLYATEPGLPPSSPDLALYCQPWQVATEVSDGAAHLRTEAEPEELLTPRVRSSLEDNDATPLWIAAALRFVERTEWWLRQARTAEPGIRSALDTLSRVVAEYAEAEVPPVPTPASQVVGSAPGTPIRSSDPRRAEGPKEG